MYETRLSIFASAAILALLASVPSRGQVRLMGSRPGDEVRLFPADLAVLDLQEVRNDLSCVVAPLDPILGFELRHHSGYEVRIPVAELATLGNRLKILFRVMPERATGERYYFLQRIPVPAIKETANGNVVLRGYFDIGEGRYHIGWLMRDGRQRICSAFWDVEVALKGDDKELKLAIAPGVAEAAEFEQFKEELPVMREARDNLLRVKMLVNFAPQIAESTTMQPLDTSALLSVLRGISRSPNIGKFSVVAFNLRERRVFYRQDNSDRIDFPALGRALESLNPGTVDFSSLADKHGDTKFLQKLIETETKGKQDALVFVGPKAMLEENVPEKKLIEIGDLSYPVFYMNCNFYPGRMPWRDAIGRVVSFFKGSEFLISQPRDVFFAIEEMVSRSLSFRRGLTDKNPEMSTK
jgi:hypothetical protein